MSKQVVLVVDDDPHIQNLISIHLSMLNVDIHSALTGEEGIEKYKELMEKDRKPNIVVMDLNLTQFGEGEIDGVETTKKIMRLDSDAVVYGFTAFFSTKWSRELEEVGAKGIIARTVGFDSFREIMKQVLAGKKIKIQKFNS